jgi:CTP synthase (UTP-ammonia lyase)
MPEQIVEFVQEKANLPKVGTFVAQMCGAADAELIIVDDGTATTRKIGIAKQIVVCRSRPAVNNEKRNAI